MRDCSADKMRKLCAHWRSWRYIANAIFIIISRQNTHTHTLHITHHTGKPVCSVTMYCVVCSIYAYGKMTTMYTRCHTIAKINDINSFDLIKSPPHSQHLSSIILISHTARMWYTSTHIWTGRHTRTHTHTPYRIAFTKFSLLSVCLTNGIYGEQRYAKNFNGSFYNSCSICQIWWWIDWIGEVSTTATTKKKENNSNIYPKKKKNICFRCLR